MKRVLVLGGGGFIGRNIVKSLVERCDCIVTAADIRSDHDLDEILNDVNKSSRLKLVINDFTKVSAFQELNDTYDEIYMLAALVGVNKTLNNPEEVIRINTCLTMNTLNFVANNPVKKILFASSSENYAGTSDLYDVDIPTSEDVPLCISDIFHPRWTYAITKMHGESSFIHSSRAYNYQCTVVRYQNIIGPNMGFGHAIPHIVERFKKASNDNSFKIYGHDQTRAFCYIDDAVDGTIKAMENENANGQIYHIGNDQEITMRELTTYIGTILKYDGVYENAVTYPGSVSRRCPDISKAIDEINYKPIFDWKDSVIKTVSWYNEFFQSGGIPSSGGFIPPELVLKNK